MAKKRTGLQSEIAGIFSGVPVPKKGGARSRPDSPAQKPDSPASKPSGSVIPEPVTPQPQAPVAPTPKKIEEPAPPAAPKPKVVEINAPEQVVKKIPKKIPRRRKDKTFATKAGVRASRQKVSIVLFVVFSTALVIVLARQYLMPTGNPGIPTITPDIDNLTKNNIEIDWPIPPIYSADLRDPMVLGQVPPPPPPPGEVVVRGIVVSEDRKYAVIGTNYLQEGGIVPGTNIKVKKINPNNVEFEEDGETWTQKVEGEKR